MCIPTVYHKHRKSRYLLNYYSFNKFGNRENTMNIANPSLYSHRAHNKIIMVNFAVVHLFAKLTLEI